MKTKTQRDPIEFNLFKYENYLDGDAASISFENCTLCVDTKHHKAGQHIMSITINWENATMSIFDTPEDQEPSEVVNIKLIVDTNT